jgi:hypothetical protein
MDAARWIDSGCLSLKFALNTGEETERYRAATTSLVHVTWRLAIAAFAFGEGGINEHV